METKPLIVLFKHYGENAATAREPYAAWEGQVDLKEQKLACVSFDNDMLVNVNLYEVRKVEVPEWMEMSDVLNERFMVRYKYFLGFGGDPAWGRAYVEELSLFSEAAELAAITLLKTTKFRSAFRESICKQLREWLDDKPEWRTHQSPLSQTQWAAIIDERIVLKAKSYATSMYRKRELPLPYTLLSEEEALAALRKEQTVDTTTQEIARNGAA